MPFKKAVKTKELWYNVPQQQKNKRQRSRHLFFCCCGNDKMGELPSGSARCAEHSCILELSEQTVCGADRKREA